MLLFSAGCQLPPWFPLPYLHYPPGSRRSAYSLRLHCWFRPQRYPLPPGRILLECAGVQKDRVKEVGGADRCGQEGNGACRFERSDAFLCERCGQESEHKTQGIDLSVFFSPAVGRFGC
jgi:hypothetical protein